MQSPNESVNIPSASGGRLGLSSEAAGTLHDQHGKVELINEQSMIGPGIFIHGEVSGRGSLLIECKIEGSINMNNDRVIVGKAGQVTANITAREIVILGKVHGNVSASDRVEIRAEGDLTGDVTATRISLADGAYFKGKIDTKGNNAALPHEHSSAIRS